MWLYLRIDTADDSHVRQQIVGFSPRVSTNDSVELLDISLQIVKPSRIVI